MSRFILALLTTLFATPHAGVLEDMTLHSKGVPLYGKAKTPLQQQVLDKLKGSKAAEQMATLVTSVVRLKRNLGVGFTSRGYVNAMYEPKHSRITICLELLELLSKQVDAQPTLNTPELRAKVFQGALFGIFFHELGHAIIGINDIPITEREEDVADEFSLYFKVKFGEPRGVTMILPRVWFYKSLARDMSSEAEAKRTMSDEHSLGEQRTYNIACWALGSKSPSGEKVAVYVQPPQHRRDRCAKGYATLDKAMRRLFGQYLASQRA